MDDGVCGMHMQLPKHPMPFMTCNNHATTPSLPALSPQ
jgi:hypothetical protein